jgi:protein involved in polysaccharide export with SLBB domain
MIRQRIQGSGMSPDQIRARLQAAGYPSSLLDAYFGPAGAGQSPTASTQEAAAIQALGLQPVTVRATIPLDTGLVSAAQQAAQPTPTSTIFGVDLFQRTTTQFMPMMSGPVPPDYRLGAGDQLVLILTGDVEQSYSLSVTREGFILIPQVGQVYVSGLTMEDLRSLLYSRLGRVYSGVRRGPSATTHFDMSVASVGAVQPYVVGEVTQPGAYQISSLGTVLTALYAAGGVTSRGTTRHIEVQRGGRTVDTLDLYDYLLRGNTRTDIRLLSGDVVFVGLHGTHASVQGAVRRPATYELTGREALADLIRNSGGFRPDAALARVSVARILPPDQRTPDGPQRVVVDVPLGQGGSRPDVVPPFAIQDGDVVSVDSVPASERNFVAIHGNVYQPGRYALKPGLRLSQLAALAGGFKPATYSARAHIERLNVADSTRTILSIQLPRDSGDAWTEDPLLQDFDIVTVYARTDMREWISVSVVGMVNKGGQFSWREGMTLRDLVLMAGGPRIGADLQEAEIARLPTDRSHGELATTVRVPMDSTYLFDRDSMGRAIGAPGLPLRASGAPEVLLRPFDNVLILRQPDFEMQRTVDIRGQVAYPGLYALRTREDRLADLVERAGGLTPAAYPEGIRFIRTANSAGRIDVDLPRALRDHGSRDNIILQPNDSIVVPEFQASVRVGGAVNAPGSVLYRKGQGLGYYLDAAGGTTRLAVDGRASVRQANGQVETRHHFLLFFRSDPDPGPGSEVFVPARDPSDKIDYVALFGGLAQVLTSALTMLLVLRKL